MPRLRFGIFMAPFHSPVGQDPTSAYERDLDVLKQLDKLGFAVSTGSACASGKEQTSHVLRAMGCSASEAGRVLRFSAGWNTTPQDLEALLDGVLRAARELM